DGRIFCSYDQGGFTHYAILDPESGAFEKVELGLDADSTGVTAEGSTVVVVGASASVPSRIVRLHVASGSTETVRVSSELAVDPAYFSIPRAIEFPTDGGLTSHALVYAPTSPDFEAPDGERPPL